MTSEVRHEVRHHVFDTPMGACGVAWNDRGLVALQLHDRSPAVTERRLSRRAASVGAAEPPPWVAAVIADIQRYLAGEPVDFANVAVDVSMLDPFWQRLYQSMRSLAWGQTTTYGELARQLGSTDWEGARQVGEAMGRNPVPVVIPCHRVLAAGGKLGGFSAPGGAVTKAKLLALEGVQIKGAQTKGVQDDGVHVDGVAPRLPGL